MASKNVAEVSVDICVACGACTKVCPRQAITVINGCFSFVNEDLCVGCGKCAKTCPADCILIKERAS